MGTPRRRLLGQPLQPRTSLELRRRLHDARFARAARRPAADVEPGVVDPEEAFVASLSSCHMLTFLYLAGRRGFVVERYVDEAVGELSKDAGGQLAMTSVVLRPRVTFAGGRTPGAEAHEAMHHEAHDQCFIARSVKTAYAACPSRSAPDQRVPERPARSSGILSRCEPRLPRLRSFHHHPPRRAADEILRDRLAPDPLAFPITLTALWIHFPDDALPLRRRRRLAGAGPPVAP